MKRVATLLLSMLVIAALPTPAFAATGFPKGTFLMKDGSKCVEFVSGKTNDTFKLLPCSTKYKATQVWQVTDGSVRVAGQLRNVGSSTKCAYTSSTGVGPVTCVAKGSPPEKEYMSTVTSSKNIKATATSDGKTATLCWAPSLNTADCKTHKDGEGRPSALLKFTFPKPPAR